MWVFASMWRYLVYCTYLCWMGMQELETVVGFLLFTVHLIY